MTKTRTQKISWVIALFFIFLGSFYLLRSFAYAEDYEMTPWAKYEIRYFYHAKTLTKNDKRIYKEKAQYHNDMGAKHYLIAHDKCWWLPNVSEREKARTCYGLAFATVVAPTPYSKVMAALSNLLYTYGLNVIDEWNVIQTNLIQAQYNFEMCEFYTNLLENS